MSFLDDTDWTIINDFCGSQFWDSNLTWNSEYPQFTPCFEKTAFVWLPGLFLWSFLCIDIIFTFNSKTRNIPWNWKCLSRTIVLGLLIVLCIAEFIYNINRSEELFPVDIYTPLIKLSCLVLCIILVIYHRKYGQRVSGLMFLYWFLVVLMGFSQFYSEVTGYFSNEPIELRRIYFTVYYSLCFTMFLLYWFVDPPPKHLDHAKLQCPNPEQGACFPSRLIYAWYDKLIYKGYKRPLTNKDLWSMNHEDSAGQLYQVFSKYWNQAYKKKTFKEVPAELKKVNSVDFNGTKEVKSKTISIVPTLIRAFGVPFLFGSFLQFFDLILTFASPELLKLVINFVSSNEPIWHGYFYAAALLLVNSIQSLINSQAFQRTQIVGLRMRTALTTAIYRKALKLSSSARKDSTLGEIVNLMAVDSNMLMMLIPLLNILWSSPLRIALALVFLWKELGPSVLMGLGVMLVMIPANAFFANLTKKLQAKQMKYKDERVKTINEILSGMKVLKLYGWEPSFEEQVQQIRQKEGKVLKQAAYLRAAVSFIWICTPFLVSLLTFMTYVLIDEKNVLDSAKVFVSISLFNIMKQPLAMVPMMISSLVQTTVSIKRLNKFLNKEELDLNVISHDDKDDDPLVIEKGTFSWDADQEPALRNINIRVKAGSLVAVVGAVGAGKSSFISAFLGEMNKVSGRVNTRGSIAYVPQVAWIQNCTLQDNILFGRDLDNKKYHRVIEACALKPDLKMLSGGDQTEIGERGINVSGGQKQRISLARAVYSDCDVYFLDDPLSAVDSHVGKHIFDNVISSTGVLSKKTRILVTHGITFLPEVDLIVVLSDGEISEVGTYHELLEKKGAFSEFLITHLQDIPEEELKEIDTTMKENIIKSNPEFHRQLSISRSMKSLASTNSSVSSQRDTRRSSQISHKSEIKEKPKMNKLIEEEKAEEGRVKWNVYSKYFHAVGWFFFFVNAILSFLTQGLQIGSNLWLSEWSDDQELVINGTTNISKRNMYLGIYGLFGITQTLAAFFGSLVWYVGCVKAGLLLHYLLLQNIMRSPMSFFDTTPQGRIINRFSREIDVLDNLIPLVIKQFFSMVTPVIGTFIVISYSTPMFLVLILPIGLVYYFVQKLYIASSQQLRRIESVTRSPVFSYFSESVSGASVIRAYSAQKRFIKESEMKIDLNQSASYSGIIASRWLAVRLQLIGNFIIFFATLFAIIGKDTLSPGIVGLSVSYTLQITIALNFLVQVTAEVENNIIAVERIKEYTVTPQEAPREITPNLAASDWPQEGKVEFIDYQVRYREGLDLVLRGINLTINGGEKIGIVGRTGAGKSSITLCLFRIIESAGGKILIDGIDIAKLGLQTLRSKITIIPQDPVLFSGSLRMNLDPFGHYSDDQVWRALELAHLKPYVKGLPAGLQHQVTEGGENISVGQRQLICLARALLRKTKILILDEATAAVDLETDDFIQKTIRSEFNDCTVLTIAHRINTIMDSDRVLVLNQGQVVEFDTPNALLKDKNSIFYSMAYDAGLV